MATLAVVWKGGGWVDKKALQHSPLALEDTQDLASSDAGDLGDAAAITQDNTDLGGGGALPGQLADLLKEPWDFIYLALSIRLGSSRFATHDVPHKMFATIISRLLTWSMTSVPVVLHQEGAERL